MFNFDPLSRIILWFNAVGTESFITSLLAAQDYYRIDGSGIYVSLSTPIEFLVTFDRLFLQVMRFDAGLLDFQLDINIENWSLDKGDQS